MMATSEQYFSLVKTSKSSWVAVPKDQTVQGADGTVSRREPDAASLRNVAPVSGRLFAQASGADAKFAERFPRLTIALITLAIFSISITAEVELLRQAGYFWR